MNLVPEKFKLIPKSYNGNDFMKIQYEDKDLVKKTQRRISYHGGKKIRFAPCVHSR